jgi:hypothetical protein
MGALVENMVWIHQRNDNIHIEQSAHESQILGVLQLPHVLQGDQFPARGQDGHAPAHTRTPLSSGCGRRQAASGEGRKGFPHAPALAAGQFPGRLQDVIFKVQSSSHASDVKASTHQCQTPACWVMVATSHF